MKLEYTRKIINAIHDGSLLNAQYEATPIFNLAVPTQVKGVPTEVLHPENSVGDMTLKTMACKGLEELCALEDVCCLSEILLMGMKLGQISKCFNQLVFELANALSISERE